MSLVLYALGSLVAFMYLQETTFVYEKQPRVVSIQELITQVCAALVWPLMVGLLAYHSRYELGSVFTTLADLWPPTLDNLEVTEDLDSEPDVFGFDLGPDPFE